MKIVKRSGSDTRRILIGMVVDPVVCGRIAAHWDDNEGLFAEKWANLVGGWCVHFHAKYNRAPAGRIEGMFEAWASRGRKDTETVGLVEKFLASLSQEYEQHAKEQNTQYTLDLAEAHFEKVALERFYDAGRGDLDDGNAKAALARIQKFGRTELSAGAGIDIMRDETAWKQAFEEETEPIITYPKDLGRFFGSALQRDGFVALMGSAKRGKSFWLMDLVWRAMSQRRKCAYFHVGDMSQSQVLRRWGARAARHPLKPRTLKIPTILENNDGQICIEHEEKTFQEGLSWKAALAACKKITEMKCKSDEVMCRLSCHANSSISINGIRAILQTWERGGWVPDVVAVDYADILAPPERNLESRDQINATWKGMRRLSQELHCLVLTATQADADSFNAHTLGRRNFADDRRKFDHVTGMLGINSTEAEAANGIQRLNWLAWRDDGYTESACVHVAGCLALAAPAMRSCF